MLQKKRFLHILLIAILFTASQSFYAQTIDNVSVSSYSICKPSTIDVTFKITNGNGTPKYFTNATNYVIDLGTLSGNTFTIVHSQNYPAPSNAPSSVNGASTFLTKSFSIPPTVSDGINYQVIISASNPTAGFTLASLSPIFEIKSKPASPTVSNNGPVCSGGTLSLTASAALGATYSWTGPNGFTSNQQNPVVSTNASTAMSGTYSLIITGINGCASAPSTTNVIVSSSGRWIGSVSTDWNNPSNWGCGNIPNLNTNVFITTGLTNYPILNTGAIGSANNITVQSGASLGVLNNTLEIAGIITNNGIIDVLNGTVSFKGSVLQSISANTFLNNKIKNLTVNNPSNVSLSGPLEITGMVRTTSGNLNSGGFLTLISDNIQTALIDGSGSGQVLGSVKMQRYINPAFGYKYLSSPFSNTVVGDYQLYVDLTTNFPNFYKYTENRNDGPGREATGWEAYTALTSPVNVMSGYALNFGNVATPKTVNIEGTVNNGNQQINLRNTNGTYTQGFNLVGNPYPSPIDWNSGSGWTKTNVDNALYFFTASTTDQYSGTYSSYVNGVQSADGKSSNIIPSMQGFFVHVSDLAIYPVDGILGMTNAVRVNNFSQQFLKSSKTQDHSLIRISTSMEKFNLKDYMVLYFDDQASKSFDKNLDALKMMNTDSQVPNIYGLTAENRKLSIKALDYPGNQPYIFPLGITNRDKGWQNIQLEDLQNISSNLFVYLIDTKKRIGQNLLERPIYRFHKNEGTIDSRFHILISNKAISDPAIAFNEHFSINTIDDDVVVKMNLPVDGTGFLQISTLTGQNIERINVSGKNEYIINQIHSSGIYFFSLKFRDELFTRKIIIKK